MKQLFLFLVGTIVVICCESNRNNNLENTTVTKTESIPNVVEAATEAVEEEQEPISFPFIGAASIAAYDLEREHKYGGGDCFADVLEYVSGNNSICIDSMSCGDYGFTTTRYMLSNDELMMVHIANISNSEASWEEKIYDFRKMPYSQYERKGTLNQGTGKEKAYQNKPSATSKVKLSVSPEELQEQYLGLFDQKLEED